VATLTVSGPCRWAAVLLAVTLAPFAACSGDDGGAPNAGGAAGADSNGLGRGGVPAAELPYAPCPEGDVAGQFVIELGDGFTSVGGQVTEGVLPGAVPDELARAGDCRLLRARQTTCVPACAISTERCDSEGVCMALPRTHDVGTVTVHGLAIPMQMRANAVTRKYSNPALPMLPNPGFLPGADLRITSAGGDYAPFELRGWGVSPLVLGSEPIEIAEGQPTRLGWQAPATAGPARLHIELNINHHGSTNAKIECDFADTGAAEISATLIDGLIAEGLSGFPTLTATRRSATSLQIEPGCVELLVISEVSVSVRVEGITSCNTNMPCPIGQTCLQVELFCQ
jgi:hypothetical protein